MPNDTTTAVQHPPKDHLGLPTTSWLRPSSFENPGVHTLGNGQVQHIPVSFTMTQVLPRLLTVNNGCSAAASSPMHLQANHAPRVTPPIAHATCRNSEEWVFQHNSHPCKTEASTPDMFLSTHSLVDEPPAVAASGVILTWAHDCNTCTSSKL